MSNSLHKKYAYRIVWSPDYTLYVGLCAEFPRLSFKADTQLTALEGIIAEVEEVVDLMRQDGDIVPEPLALKEYSGEFMVRTTPQVHRRLTIEAAERNMSLNRLVNGKIS